MLLSKNWLKRHIDFNLTDDELSEILTAIGLEVEGMESVESIKGGLKGIVCGKVETCSQHPNADRLKTTTVNVGGQVLNIVCGAPNVAAGQHVWVATEGTELYGEDGSSFTIKKTKIRGEESCGMICAEDEIGLGSSHDGIMVLPESIQPGSKASEHYEISNDIVYEIGLTPNRSDGTNHRGVAEDLAAYLKVNNYEHELHPINQNAIEYGVDSVIDIEILDSDKCPRYSGVCLEGFVIKESPTWMQHLLTAIGVKTINNIVDITNFVLHDLGQPLHAFDQSKIGGNQIKVQTLEAGTEFISLDGVNRKLLAGDLMICDGNDKPMCIGGVFGGLDSGVTEGTSSIFLESAHFEATTIRVSSTKHNLRTDAAKVFEKGSDPRITIQALDKACELLTEYADAKINGKIFDYKAKAFEPLTLDVRISRINAVIGVQMAEDKIIEILEALSMEPSRDGDTITVKVPTNKADVTREIDVIEEILRIYGFNQVGMEDSLQIPLIPSDYPSLANLRESLAEALVGAGFNEMMGLSLIESKYAESFDESQLVHIHNTSNIHLDVMRPSMLISGLVNVRHNLNYQNLDLKLFEFGKIYQSGDDYQEQELLTVFRSGSTTPQHWSQETTETTFYDLKSSIDLVLNRLGIQGYQIQKLESAELVEALEYRRGPMQLVRFGRVNQEMRARLDIKQEVYYAEFDISTLFKLYKGSNVTFSRISKFPTSQRDLALVVDNDVEYSQIEQVINKVGKGILQSVSLFDIYKSEKHLGKGKKSYAVSMTFGAEDKTLTDNELNPVMNKIIKELEAKVGAQVRK